MARGRKPAQGRWPPGQYRVEKAWDGWPDCLALPFLGPEPGIQGIGRGGEGVNPDSLWSWACLPTVPPIDIASNMQGGHKLSSPDVLKAREGLHTKGKGL